MEYLPVAAIIIVAGISFMLWTSLKAAHDEDIRNGDHDE